MGRILSPDEDDFYRPRDSAGFITLIYEDELVHMRNFVTDYAEDVAEIKRMYALQGRAERRKLTGFPPTKVYLNVHITREADARIISEEY